MKTDIVYGVEKVEIGLSTGSLTAPSVIVVANNIEDGSVSYTTNKDTSTPIIPEDKDAALVTLFTPSAGDAFNFALLEFSDENIELIMNVEVDNSTTTTTVLAKKKHANLWIRLTTRPQFGVKKVFVYPVTVCDVDYKNNFSKNVLVALAITATLSTFVTDSGKDAIYTMQKVNEDGSPINSSPTFDSTIDFTTDASPAAVSGVTGTISATNATVKFKFNAISSPVGTPVNMVIKIAGVTKMSVDFPSDYLNSSFQYVDSTGGTHNGTFASGDVTLT